MTKDIPGPKAAFREKSKITVPYCTSPKIRPYRELLAGSLPDRSEGNRFVIALASIYNSAFKRNVHHLNLIGQIRVASDTITIEGQVQAIIYELSRKVFHSSDNMTATIEMIVKQYVKDQGLL